MQQARVCQPGPPLQRTSCLPPPCRHTRSLLLEGAHLAYKGAQAEGTGYKYGRPAQDPNPCSSCRCRCCCCIEVCVYITLAIIRAPHRQSRSYLINCLALGGWMQGGSCKLRGTAGCCKCRCIIWAQWRVRCPVTDGKQDGK